MSDCFEFGGLKCRFSRMGISVAREFTARKGVAVVRLAVSIDGAWLASLDALHELRIYSLDAMQVPPAAQSFRPPRPPAVSVSRPRRSQPACPGAALPPCRLTAAIEILRRGCSCKPRLACRLSSHLQLQ